MSTLRIPTPLKSMRAIATLAWPIVLSRIGVFSLELVDTMVIGRVGTAELAAAGAGSALFWFVGVTITGFILPVDSMMSRAFGEADSEKAHNVFAHALILGFFAALFGTLVLSITSQYLAVLGVAPDFLATAKVFLQVIGFSLPLAVAITTFNLFWQAKQRPIVLAWMVIVANVLNYILDLAFVFGYWGFPKLGAPGAAWATLLVRSFMLLSLFLMSEYLYGGLFSRQLRRAWRLDRILIYKMTRLGIPSAVQSAAEVGAFSLTSLMVARLGAVPMALHYIVLRVVSLTLMVSMGIAQAISVRVSYFLGRRDLSGAREAGAAGLYLAVLVMLVAGAMLICGRQTVLRSFTHDELVIAAGLNLMICVGIFQIFDALQVCCAGALRGIGNTDRVMRTNLVGYYLFALPLAWFLCFYQSWSVLGIWVGLASGLVMISGANIWYWWSLSRKISA